MAPRLSLGPRARQIGLTNQSFTTSPCLRAFTSTSYKPEAPVQQESGAPTIDPSWIGTKKEENILREHGVKIPGSRRRRVAIRDSPNIPFEQLPYQCFQEARKILAEDREEKLRKIEIERERIAKVQARDASEFAEFGGENVKKGKLTAMNKYLSELIINADYNDPMIRKRFEDGFGDMDKPIYRHLAEKKWRSYKRLVLQQRVTQMHVVPDVIPHIDLTADVSIAFGRKKVQPGEFVNSKISETAPKLDIQVFDPGSRLVSIVVINPDVPNPVIDGFDSRCHFLASDVELSPNQPQINLNELEPDKIALPWIPAYAQKGSPYQRLAILVLQQLEGKSIDVNQVKETSQAHGFNLRSFNSKHHVKPISATLFRTIWDENTASVMNRAGIEGSDIELKRRRPEPLEWFRNVKDGDRYR